MDKDVWRVYEKKHFFVALKCIQVNILGYKAPSFMN